MTEETKDLPLIVAQIISVAPSLVIRSGAAFLRLKSRSRKAAQTLEGALVANGMPSWAAHELAENFASDLSVRRLIASAGRQRPGG